MMGLSVRSKTRIINFRVTEEEYRVIQQLWQENGARSLSDCVRGLVLGCATSDGPPIDDRFNALEERVRCLELSSLGVSVGQAAADRTKQPQL
jgi:hypothetical protein